MSTLENLESLLVDLQNTTEVLRRANLSDRYGGSQDIEPIYQEQHRRTNNSERGAERVDRYERGSSERGEVRRPAHLLSDSAYRSASHGLDDVEQLVNEYSNRRKSYGERSDVASPSRPSVHNLFQQLDDRASNRADLSGSRRSLAPPNGSYNDLRRSPSRDPSQADSMIGELSSKHGISTIPKGDCAHCGKPIIGQVVIALGKMWHPEHFTCCECHEELGHRNFFERAGKAYCEHDYHNQYSPRCAQCNGAIKDRCVTAMGRTWHIEHFTCAECGKEFGDQGYHEKDGRAFCRSDFFRLYAPKCNGCSQPIKQNFITALGTHWHPDCFVCQMCGCGFAGGAFFEADGRPLCETHFHEHRGSLCSQCRLPIAGRCVTAMGRKYHPEHFRCTYCNKQLTKGTFKDVDSRPFCHKCYQTTHVV